MTDSVVLSNRFIPDQDDCGGCWVRKECLITENSSDNAQQIIVINLKQLAEKKN